MNKFKIKSLIAILLSTLLILGLASCGTSNDNSKVDNNSGGSGKKEINLMTWANFVPAEIIKDFEEKESIKVNYKHVSTNEEMQDLMKANPDQYDLAAVTDYMVNIMVKNEMLEDFDKSKMPNFSNINPVYQGNYYDKDNKYSIPYAVSTAFLLVNPEGVKKLGAKEITGFADLWQPELKNNVVVIDWSVEIMGVALKALGHEFNETDKDIVAQAKDKLMKLRPNIVRFETNTPEESLINKEAVVGYMQSNQAVKGKNEDDSLEPVFPKEGMPIYIDSFVMSKSAPNKENAYKFLNYIMDPKVSAKISKLTNFTNTNSKATQYLPEEFKNNPMLNLSDDVVKNTSFYIDVDKVLDEYDHIYTEFKMK